ncbi:MAG: response regulator [Planctomycetes bacterium]|nr:response regulator [Planctomycetota bacterium]
MTTRTIMVVEDDPDLRELLCCLLTSDHVQTVGYPDGHKAAEHLMREAPPAAILLDLRLPVLNGWDLLAWARRQPGLEDVPVVVISGATFERAELTLEHPPVTWLPKPVDPAALVRALEGVLTRG